MGESGAWASSVGIPAVVHGRGQYLPSFLYFGASVVPKSLASPGTVATLSGNLVWRGVIFVLFSG